jgi:3-hydroxyisobutyrate dehydrogenase-like beta-hydroxyacid dehydrogenase
MTSDAAIAFVGAGQMGAPMVRRLLAAGRNTTVFARRAEVRDELSGLGARVTADLGEAVRDADIVLTCLYSDAQLDEVALGPRGILAAMQPGSILVIHSTWSPATATALAEAGAPRGVHVVDAPVSGSADQIEEGRLTVMLGGDPDDVARVRAVVADYADPIFTVGALGSAQVVKLVNNALFAANVQLAAEAERVANELGVDTATLATVIQQSSGATYVMGLVGAMGSIAPLVAGAGHFMRKDVDVVKQVARSLDVDLGALGEMTDGGPVTFVGRPTNEASAS